MQDELGLPDLGLVLLGRDGVDTPPRHTQRWLSSVARQTA